MNTRYVQKPDSAGDSTQLRKETVLQIWGIYIYTGQQTEDFSTVLIGGFSSYSHSGFSPRYNTLFNYSVHRLHTPVPPFNTDNFLNLFESSD